MIRGAPRGAYAEAQPRGAGQEGRLPHGCRRGHVPDRERRARPGPKRLEGIANTLGLSVQGWRPVARNGLLSRTGRMGPSDGRGGADPADAGTLLAARATESTKDRMRRVQGEFDRRNTQAVTGGLAFNAAHDRARDDFFMELVSSARGITGPPSPPAPAAVTVAGDLSLSPTTEAALRRQVAARHQQAPPRAPAPRRPWMSRTPSPPTAP